MRFFHRNTLSFRVPIILIFTMLLYSCATPFAKQDNTLDNTVENFTYYVLLNGMDDNPLRGEKDKNFIEYSTNLVTIFDGFGWQRLQYHELKGDKREGTNVITMRYGVTNTSGAELPAPKPTKLQDLLADAKEVATATAEIAWTAFIFLAIIVLLVLIISSGGSDIPLDFSSFGSGNGEGQNNGEGQSNGGGDDQSNGEGESNGGGNDESNGEGESNGGGDASSSYHDVTGSFLQVANDNQPTLHYHQLIISGVVLENSSIFDKIFNQNDAKKEAEKLLEKQWRVSIEGYHKTDDLSLTMPYLIEAATPHIGKNYNSIQANQTIDLSDKIPLRL